MENVKMAKLTQLQKENIRKDFVLKIMNIDKLKIRDEQKIYLIEEFLEGYKRGFEIGTGTTFGNKEVAIISGIDDQLTNFKDQVGKAEPGIEIIGFIADYNWGEIVKWMNITKNDK